jgi:flagellar protein FliS
MAAAPQFTMHNSQFGKKSDQMQQAVLINSRPQDAYRRQDVLTANSVDLIVMLYDALKKNIVLGKRGIIKTDIDGAHKHLMKAQEIVVALINSLDMNYQISEDLLALYEFLLRSMGEANMRKDAQALEPLIEIVDELRSAWNQISLTNKGSMYISEGHA